MAQVRCCSPEMAELTIDRKRLLKASARGVQLTSNHADYPDQSQGGRFALTILQLSIDRQGPEVGLQRLVDVPLVPEDHGRAVERCCLPALIVPCQRL